MANNEKIKIILRNLLLDIGGAICLAIALKVFAAPNLIAPGGVSGIATLINYLTGFPIGVATLIMNLPLLIVAYKLLGKGVIKSTLVTLTLSVIFTDVILRSPPVYMGDSLLAALFGGLFYGIGGGLVFMHGSTAGGTDILMKLIQKKYPYMSTGQLTTGINAVIVITAALVYKNIESALCGLVLMYAAGRVIDSVLYGMDVSKFCMIVTLKPKEMSQAIITQLNRSATIMDGTGAYKRQETWMLFCVVRKQEYYRLKRIIRDVDPTAFVIVSEAQQVVGSGFKDINAADN